MTTPDIYAVASQWNMGRRERALAMLEGNEALIAQLKAEIARLEDTSGPRKLLEHDEMSRQIYRVLKVIQAQVANH